MADAPTTQPLSDFLRNAEGNIGRLKASRTPEILTIDGRAEVVVQDAESYRSMVEELERSRLADSLVAAERDYEAGKMRLAGDFFADMKAKYGGV